jgi:tRNA pseudouridine38-40 synthase
MIRNIVGALVVVGAGSHDDAWIGDVLRARDRRIAPPTFAPDGLYFTGADYDARFDLPASRREVAVPG